LLLGGLTIAAYSQAQTVASAQQELVSQLLAASTPEARRALLSTHDKLLKPALAEALMDTAKKLPDRKQASEIYALAAEVAEQAKAPEQAATAFNSLGVALSNLGDRDRALTAFEKSLQLRRALNKPLDVAKTLNNIAAMYQYKAQYDRCLAANEESLHIKQQLLRQTPQDAELKKAVATSHVNLGLLHKFLGNLPLAVQHYQQGLKRHQELGNQFESAAALNNLGVAYFEQRLDDRALDHYQQALQQNSAASKADPEQKAQILNNIGQLHLQNKHYALALEACSESLRLREPLGNQEKIARTKKHLALIHLAQKNYPAALKFATESAQLSQQLPENYWSARSIAGQAHLKQNQLEQAQQCFADAISVIEKLRTQAAISPEIKQRFFENKVTPYLAMVDILVAQARPLEALAYAERTKARVLLDLIASRSNERLSAPSLNAAQTLTLAETEALLPDAKTALLEFIIADEKVYLFALHCPAARAELRVFPLAINKAQLTELVTRFRQELATRKLSFTASAEALHQQLLKPAQSILTGKTSLVIVPDGVLWELPFQALMPAKGRYLLEDHNIAYAPSLTALREITKRKPTTAHASQTLLAFGNPALAATANLPPLPNTEKQVRELGALFGATVSKIYLGAEASEQRFKAEAANYSILNLATHGIFDDQQPMASRVLLAQAGNEDGALEAHEIMRLQLKADLVVLSACETARGHIGPGEGVIGLTWAFLNAGAPTVVVSQWQVREDSTAALMQAFYRHIKTPTANLTRAEALRQAALSVMKDNRYRHPFYWAGFVLVGDGF
jgi:CHAT domain-containing protein